MGLCVVEMITWMIIGIRLINQTINAINWKKTIISPYQLKKIKMSKIKTIKKK
jgi:hypothetical protein